MFRLSTGGSRAFNVSGPQIWNELPDEVVSASTFAVGAGRAECPPTVQICYSVKWFVDRGAVPCRTLYVSTAILYWIRSGTRSQCKMMMII